MLSSNSHHLLVFGKNRVRVEFLFTPYPRKGLKQTVEFGALSAPFFSSDEEMFFMKFGTEILCLASAVAIRVTLCFSCLCYMTITHLNQDYIHYEANLESIMFRFWIINLCIYGVDVIRTDYDIEQLINSLVNLLFKICYWELHCCFEYSLVGASYVPFVAPHVSFVMFHRFEQVGVYDLLSDVPGYCIADSLLTWLTSSQPKGMCKNIKTFELMQISITIEEALDSFYPARGSTIHQNLDYECFLLLCCMSLFVQTYIEKDVPEELNCSKDGSANINEKSDKGRSNRFRNYWVCLHILLAQFSHLIAAVWWLCWIVWNNLSLLEHLVLKVWSISYLVNCNGVYYLVSYTGTSGTSLVVPSSIPDDANCGWRLATLFFATQAELDMLVGPSFFRRDAS